MVFDQLYVGVNHQLHQILEFCLWFPAELFFGLGIVTDEKIHFGGTEIILVNFHIFLPIKAGVGKGNLQKFADAVGFVGGNDIIVRPILLQHEPHGLDVFLGVTPVALGIEVAEIDLVLKAERDRGCQDKFYPANRP